MKAFSAVILCVAGALAGEVVVEKHAPQPYKFGYESQDEWGNAQSRHEQDLGDGVKTGSYGYRDALGIFRHVNYVADHDGFRAWVKTNEPGTSDSAPAAVKIEKNPEHIVKAAPIVTAHKNVVAPVAASPVAVYAPAPAHQAVAPIVAAPVPVRPRHLAPSYAPHIAYGSKLAAGPILAGPRYSAYAVPVHAPRSAPLVHAASRIDPATTAHAVPVPVRKLVGPSAAAFVKPVAPIVSRLVASPSAVSGPILSSGLHAASSDTIVVAPSVVSAPLVQRKRPYEKFADTFRRRRPIKTIGDKEVYVPPTLVTAGGVPVYKDK